MLKEQARCVLRLSRASLGRRTDSPNEENVMPASRKDNTNEAVNKAADATRDAADRDGPHHAPGHG